MPEIKPIKLVPSILLFLIPGILFYIIINTLVPFISQKINVNSYIVWMFTGTFLLFGLLFATTFILLKKDGYHLDWQTIKTRLRLKKITLKDLLWIIVGMIICSIITGLLIWVYSIFSKSFSISDLKEISPIKVYPLIGNQLFFLFFMPIFYFFNYVGEELLWRGYILPRQEITKYGKYAWLINMLLHLVFHMAFIKGILFFLPFMLLMPYIVYKRKNTSLSIVIHFLLGGPTQLFVAIGLLQ